MLPKKSTLEFIAQTSLPTLSGDLIVRAYRNKKSNHEPIAILSGDITTMKSIPVRVHDACFTSEVLGSLKCDCNQQLQFSLQYIQKHGGVVIYLHQEGRGIGLANKLAAYALQEQGLDTLEANRALHLPDDCRNYHDAVAILSDLGVQDISLLTNNPNKIEKIRSLGIRINSRIPIEPKCTTQNRQYLVTKAEKMGHLINIFQNQDID